MIEWLLDRNISPLIQHMLGNVIYKEHRMNTQPRSRLFVKYKAYKPHRRQPWHRVDKPIWIVRLITGTWCGETAPHHALDTSPICQLMSSVWLAEFNTFLSQNINRNVITIRPLVVLRVLCSISRGFLQYHVTPVSVSRST